MNAPAVDAARVVADLRELDSRTGGDGGALRPCWTEGWREARGLLAELLGEIGVEHRVDQAGNAWARLPGDDGSAPALVLGSHLDSVPAGGWLDGALGVMAGLGVLRAWAGSGETPAVPLALVDWADEEGAFGRSLLGSAAVCGTLDTGEVAGLRDRSGRPAADVLAENGIDLERMPEAGDRLGGIGAYLELHIEQGPVLEGRGIACAAVTGCAGLERVRIRFEGAASHAGTTPMDMRRDAGLAAAETALDTERVAREAGGVGTTGELVLEPGAMTVIPGASELAVDLRHADAGALAGMLDAVRRAATERAAARGCTANTKPVWSIDPVAFDAGIAAAAAESCGEVTGEAFSMPSGALHDAAEVARVRPAGMVFCSSLAGVSHSPSEDTSEDDLIAAIEAFGSLANRYCNGSTVFSE